MKKAIWTVLILLVFSIVFAGCGSISKGNESSRNEQPSSSSKAETPSSTPQEKPSSASSESNTENKESSVDIPEQESINLDDYEWETVDGGIKITNYKGNAKRVVLPSIIENKKVIAIDERAFSGNPFIEELIGSEYIVNAVGDFKNCDSLKKIEFPCATEMSPISSSTCETLILPKVKTVWVYYLESMSNLKHLEVPSLEKLALKYKQKNHIEFTLETLVLPDDFNEKPIYATIDRYKNADGEWANFTLRLGTWELDEEEFEVLYETDILKYLPDLLGLDSLTINGKTVTGVPIEIPDVED